MTSAREPREEISLSLRDLYARFGYSRYSMNKFEEYDLYARNKDFLVSEQVITFTDGTGKLLALKPDVTLSIVKNTRDGDGVRKLYYNENVYRVAKGSRNFREIPQLGLECIGDLDAYAVYEVLRLAKKSLDLIAEENVLAVSHLGLLSEVIDAIGVPVSRKSEVFSLIGGKNAHELSALLSSVGVAEEKAKRLLSLLEATGDAKTVLPAVRALLSGLLSEKTVAAMEEVLLPLSAETAISVDFSVVGDPNYYNGFVFRGFVEGIPDSVLSGGQYDKLMEKMGRRSRAVGFAVYLDLLARRFAPVADFDADILLKYDTGCPLSAVFAMAETLGKGGKTVLSSPAVPEGLRFRKLISIDKEGKIS